MRSGLPVGHSSGQGNTPAAALPDEIADIDSALFVRLRNAVVRHEPIFEPLRDPEYFCRFTLDPELETLVWPNGADFAPEFLHDNIRVTA